MIDNSELIREFTLGFDIWAKKFPDHTEFTICIGSHPSFVVTDYNTKIIDIYFKLMNNKCYF